MNTWVTDRKKAVKDLGGDPADLAMDVLADERRPGEPAQPQSPVLPQPRHGVTPGS